MYAISSYSYLFNRTDIHACLQLAHQAKDCNLAYYVLGTSTSVPKKGRGLGWSLEFSSHPQIGDWANEQCQFRRVFAAYAQGASISEAVGASKVSAKILKAPKAGTQPCDVVKGRLSALLALLISKLV